MAHRKRWRETIQEDDMAQVPLGFVRAGPEGSGRQMKTPETVPEAVLASIKRWKERHPMPAEDTAEKILERLRFDTLNGCYFFMIGSMYHGVELDGHIHT